MPSYDRFNNHSNVVDNNNSINNKRNSASNDDSDDRSSHSSGGVGGGKNNHNHNIPAIAETRLSIGDSATESGDGKTADDGGHKLNTDALNQTPVEHHVLRRIVHHLAFRLVSLILILIDITILLVSVVTEPDEETLNTYNRIAMAFSIIFVAELCLRVYAQG